MSGGAGGMRGRGGGSNGDLLGLIHPQSGFEEEIHYNKKGLEKM